MTLLDGIEYLTRANFKLYCAKNYKNPDNPDLKSLGTDLFIIAHIKRFISNYAEKGEIRDRQILNHIITLTNLFGPEPTTRILFFRVDDKYHYILKTFLDHLGLVPEVITGLKKPIHSSKILFDERLRKRLENT